MTDSQGEFMQRGQPARAGLAPSLRRFARRPAPPTAPVAERCELCGAALPMEHRHLFDCTQARLACACVACALLFERPGAAGGKYLTVPQRYLALCDFHMSDAQWDDLMIPVNMAFIYVNAEGRPVAYYPSPAGATESLLTLEHWQALVDENSILASLAPDVEALLINRLRGAQGYYLVPIDACYQLVGVLRTTWRGLSGGEEAATAITAYFAALRERALPVGAAASARGASAEGGMDAGPAL